MEYTEIVRIPHVKDKLINPEKEFLYELNDFMGMPIYVYGSILRSDYFSTKSDIDVAIFANDILSAINKLILFLGINKSKIKVFKFESKNKQTHKKIKTYGYKTNYILSIEYRPEWHEKFFQRKTFKRFEISIYNLKDKEDVLNANIKHLQLPFFCSLKLFFIKLLYYYFYLNIDYYKMMKESIMNNCNDHDNKITIFSTL